MQEALKTILEIQEFDMKMLRLIDIKTERIKELDNIYSLRRELKDQLQQKEVEIVGLNKEILTNEHKIIDIKEKLKTLEAKQISVKKVEEFNALTQEMSQTERARINTEQMTSDLIDRRNMQEEILEKIKTSLNSSEESSSILEKEIKSSIKMINEEGKAIKRKRDEIATKADPAILPIYEKLLGNKRDRVIVPIENRTCSGCHITLTAQHENLVRKGERIIFCEHCSRILFWQELEAPQGEEVKPKRRRRKTT